MNEQLRNLIIPDWTENAACLNMWEFFDVGSDKYATKVCKECPVRKECFVSALEYEQKQIKRGMGTFAVVGIRGGYTVVERLDLHRDIAQCGWEVVEEILDKHSL